MNLFYHNNEEQKGMGRTLKYYYARVDNMGDYLNALIMKELFGYDITRYSPLTCEISGIGSGLGQFCLSDQRILSSIERITGRLFPKTYIWGTGFISYKDYNAFYRQNIIFNAVRGRLSLQRCEKLLGKELDIVTGDGGILAADILTKRETKRYQVGIVAHYKELDHPIFQELVKKYKDACFISAKQDALSVIKQIDQCENIISSSLHGLIIADSLRIPNLHIHVSNALLGDGFKFDDYYSAYGERHNYVDTGMRSDISIQEIRDSYAITDEMVEKMRRDMKKAFPF